MALSDDFRLEILGTGAGPAFFMDFFCHMHRGDRKYNPRRAASVWRWWTHSSELHRSNKTKKQWSLALPLPIARSRLTLDHVRLLALLSFCDTMTHTFLLAERAKRPRSKNLSVLCGNYPSPKRIDRFKLFFVHMMGYSSKVAENCQTSLDNLGEKVTGPGNCRIHPCHFLDKSTWLSTGNPLLIK